MSDNNSLLKLNWISFLLVIAVAAICCTPILGKPIYFIEAAIGIFLLFIVNKKGKSKANLSTLIPIVAYISLVLVYKVFGVSSAPWGNYMHQLFFFVCVLLYMVADDASEKQSKWIWWIVMVVALFSIVDNIVLSELYPQLRTHRDYMDEDLLRSLNAGSSIFYTYTLFFFDVCFFVFLNAANKKVKWIMFFVAAITAVFIVWYCLKGSVVLFLFLSVVLLLLSKRARNKAVLFGVTLFTLVVLLVVIKIFNDEIVDTVIRISPNERLTTRFVTLIAPENEMANEATVTGRTNLYWLSVETWLSNPMTLLFGIGDHRSTTAGIGQHADILDSLARYGCIGAIVLFAFFRRTWKYISSQFDKTYNLQLMIIFGVFILNGFVKQFLHPSIGFAVLFLLPFSSKIINNK